MTKTESILLEDFAKKSNYRKGVLAREIIMRFIKDESLRIKVIPEEIKEFRYQIFKLGSNLNQVTKKIHQDKYMSTQNQVLLSKQLSEILKVLRGVEKNIK